MIFPEIFTPYQSEIFAVFCGAPYDFKKDNPQNNDNFLLNFFKTKHSISAKKLLNPRQIHSEIIFSEKECTNNKEDKADGVYTDKKNIMCMVKNADCIGAIFYNHQKKIGATIHAGWRGLEKKIFSEFLLQFTEKERADFLIAFSPSLGPCCAEFLDPYNETPDFFHQHIIKKSENSKNSEQKYFVDLWRIAQQECINLGIPEKNIEMPLFCTKCSKNLSGKHFTERFWSHRNKDLERNGTFFMIK